MSIRVGHMLPISTLAARQILKSSISLFGPNSSRLSSSNQFFNPLYLSSFLSSFPQIKMSSLSRIATSSRLLSQSLSSSYNPQLTSIGLELGKQLQNSLSSTLTDVIYQLKRTFQPSLIRRKRKHGFLARKNSRHGLKIIHRRLEKGRRALCAWTIKVYVSSKYSWYDVIAMIIDLCDTIILLR